MQFRTRAIHVGQEADPSNGAVVPPIHLASTFVLPAANGNAQYDYARTGSPTRHAFEAVMASLDGGARGLAFASGMAATHCVTMLLKPGDHLVTGTDIYGGSWRLFNNVLAERGISITAVDTTDLAAVEDAMCAETRMLWIEPTGNPLLSVTDVAGCAALAQKAGALLVADNTLATPVLCRPLEMGADIVMHSVTKYLGGHSDVVMGALITSEQEIADEIYRIQNSSGAIAGPIDCFLVLRGIKTLHLRMQRHCENGARVAFFLQAHPKVEKVYWPGLEDHINHDIAKEQMKDFGGMLSFSLVGNRIEDAFKVVSSTHYFTLAESLGGVESLCGHPASMTHAAIPKEEREKTGVVDSLIRLSVGVEDIDDLITDLDNALNTL